MVDRGQMLLTPAQLKIVKVLEGKMATAEQLAEMLGKGYNEFKVQSMVLTLARKGVVDKVKAALILKGTNMINMLNYKTEANLKGIIPVNKKL